MQLIQCLPRPGRACEILGISRSTLYRLVRAGELELIKLGPRSSAVVGLDAFIERRRQAAKVEGRI